MAVIGLAGFWWRFVRALARAVHFTSFDNQTLPTVAVKRITVKHTQAKEMPMLVLTRKTDEEILIGDNIKITLVRVRGNSVRIGIEAPRDIRIVRGELDALDASSKTEVEVELDDCEEVFAHPQTNVTDQIVPKPIANNRVSHLMDDRDEPKATATERSIFVGRIHRPDNTDRSGGAPLARFISPR